NRTLGEPDPVQFPPEGGALDGGSRGWGSGNLHILRSPNRHRENPIAIGSLPHDERGFQKQSFPDDKPLLKQRPEKKTDPQSPRFHDIAFGSSGVGNAEAAQTETTPGGVRRVPNLDFRAERAFRRGTNALLHSPGLQI